MIKKLLFTLIFYALSSNFLHARDLKISASIKPLHSIASYISDGIIKDENINLIITDGSPHGYALKPSDVKKISSSDYILWVSDDLETFMPQTAAKFQNIKTRIWQETDGIVLLKNRNGGIWNREDEAENHGHNHDEHEEHHHDEQAEHHHHDEHDHNHGEHNPHLWLSIQNSGIFARQIAQDLSELDPENKAKYQENLDKYLKELDELKKEINKTLENAKNSSYLIFHDAYPYFEQEFGLNPRGVLRVDPEHESGAKRIAEIKKLIQEEDIKCLFNEPQFSSKISEKLAQESKIKLAVLDPVGADIPAGKDMQIILLKNLAKNLADCLGSE
ncbi:MAG: zinc ABC transporter substrate-binding protein ZnuA [Cardiobacteriaceae bacterium]|nr:zinc ABC transporter substrate-binding protein ZnuA [Cardiobacteriaceae bacterium]